MPHEHPRLQKVCSAKRRQEVVQGYFVGQVVDRQGSGDTLRSFAVQKIVGADSEIEDITWGHAGRVVVVIFLARKWSVSALRKIDQFGCNGAHRAILVRAVR